MLFGPKCVVFGLVVACSSSWGPQPPAPSSRQWAQLDSLVFVHASGSFGVDPTAMWRIERGAALKPCPAHAPAWVEIGAPHTVGLQYCSGLARYIVPVDRCESFELLPDFDPTTKRPATVLTCDDRTYFVQTMLNAIVVRSTRGGRVHLLLDHDL